MHKTKLVDWCEVVPNLVVGIEIFNFCFFVCTSQEKSGPIMIPKTVLKSGM